MRNPFILADAHLTLSGSEIDSGADTETVVFEVSTTDPADPGPAGTITVTRRPGSIVAAVAFDLESGEPTRGSGSAALQLVADWAFDALGVQTLTWTGSAGDIDGWRLAWRGGFTFEGTTRGTLDVAGEPCDAWHATLLSTDTREPKSQWLTPVRLAAPGVVLRPMTLDDEVRHLETINDPVSMLWLGTIPMARTPEAYRAVVRSDPLNATLGRFVSWTVAHPDTDVYLATISLFGIDDLDYQSGEVGYRTHPDARGRGVLTSALRAVIRHAFTPVDEGGVGLERVSLLAGDGNQASLGVARSLGFTQTGVDRHCYDLNDGRVVDLIRFDLLRTEFEGTGP